VRRGTPHGRDAVVTAFAGATRRRKLVKPGFRRRHRPQAPGRLEQKVIDRVLLELKAHSGCKCPISTKNTVSRELNVVSEVIGRRIYIIRSQKVVLSTHLGELYGVKPKTLIQAVKRKTSRFPSDFMFKLTKDEFDSLRSQIVTLEKGRGRYPKYPPPCLYGAGSRHAVERPQ